MQILQLRIWKGEKNKIKIWRTSNTIYTSGRICIFSRLWAWPKLRGYPSRSHPLCLTSSRANRAATIYMRMYSNQVTHFIFMAQKVTNSNKLQSKQNLILSYRCHNFIRNQLTRVHELLCFISNFSPSRYLCS